MTFTARSDRQLIRPRWRSNRFVVIELIAPAAPLTGARPPVNLAFVLDRSGSMGGEKIRLAARAVEEGISRLHADDRFAVVVYDDVVEVVVPGTMATPAARREAVDRLRRIAARGSTDLGAGWLRGCEQVALSLADRGVNRCLLLSDGLANRGITDRAELARHAAELRARGVSTSTFGVGDDFDEVLLASMADAGGGHFYDIATAAAIVDHMTSEVGETLEVVAREVALEVLAREDVRVESLSPYPARDGKGRAEISLGDLVSEQQVELVLRLTFPYGEVGGAMPAVFALRDRDGALDAGDRRLAWTYASDQANDEQARDHEVDRIVARTFAARTRQAAVQLNRAGDFDGARGALQATARKIRGYAGSDPELRAIVDGLMLEGNEVAQAMPERSRKVMYAQSQYDLKTRLADGSVRRGPNQPGPGASR